ncbi:MAG: HlyC/CorC family transporter [Deltaproteobacteria bacterium]|nr:HlyC/CorC family transporter [Deltaproteobacteria bacterium]
MPDFVLEILFVGLLILVNGFFALSEMALVAARKVRLKARAALKLKACPDRFLSAVQIGITLVAILTGAFSGATMAGRLQAYLLDLGLPEAYARPLGLGLMVVPVTYLTLIVGELVPKKLAVSYPERMAGLTAPAMSLFMRLAMPVVHVLSGSTRAVVGLLRIAPREEPKVTEEDIRGLIREAVIYGEVEHAERNMVERIFRLGDLQVGALMTHHARIVWLYSDDSEEKILKTILQNPHSRFPVAHREPFGVLGAVKAKEYIGDLVQGKNQGLEAHLHPLELVPETMRALNLLELFRRKDRMHFVLVVDENNEPRGVVTFNDILEAIVGHIPVPEKHDEPAAVRRADGSWLLDGLMSLDEVRSKLGIERPMHLKGQTFNTLAGFVLAHQGEPPAMGRGFDWEDHHFEIVDLDGTRIDRVLISRVPIPNR